MHTNKTIILILLVLSLSLSLILAACDSLPGLPGSAEETSVSPAQIVEYPPIVSASGKVVPEQEALLSVNTGGVVEVVLVSEGGSVTAGDVLVKLEGTEQQLAAVAAAELALANAQYNLDTLFKDTDMFAAQSLQSAEASERALEDLLNRELQEALAKQAIADAHQAIEDTERLYNFTTSTADQADIDAQKAMVVLLEDELNKAIEDFKPYENKPESNLDSRSIFIQEGSSSTSL